MARDPREPPIIGTCLFADGRTRYVYEDDHAGQFVFGDDGDPVYGVCLRPEPVDADTPAIVELSTRSTAGFPNRPVVISYLPEQREHVWTFDMSVDEAPAVVVLLFDGKEKATQFLDMCGGGLANGLWPVELESIDAAQRLLLDLRKEGVTHVEVNPTSSGRTNPEPIGQLIEKWH